MKGSSFLDAVDDLAGRYLARSAHFPDSDTVSIITWDENQEYLVTGSEVRRKGIDAVLADIADFLDTAGVPHKDSRGGK